MASSSIMSNPSSMANEATMTLSITSSKSIVEATSNGANCTLVTENPLKVTNLTTDVNVKTVSNHPINVQNIILVKEIPLSSPTTSTFSSKQHQVRRVGWSDHKAVARTLAEAFKDDDVAFYFLRTDDAAHRSEADLWKLHLEVFEYLVAAHLMNGLVLSIGENHEGVALWLEPGKDFDDFWTIFRSGMWRLYYKLTKEGRRRYFGEIFDVAHHTKVDILGQRDASSWYLSYLGTLPAARGLGYARKLVEYVTKIADATGAPCYLESSHAQNRAIYQRFGFEFKRKAVLKRGKVPVVWESMVREPLCDEGLTLYFVNEGSSTIYAGEVGVALHRP